MMAPDSLYGQPAGLSLIFTTGDAWRPPLLVNLRSEDSPAPCADLIAPIPPRSTHCLDHAIANAFTRVLVDYAAPRRGDRMPCLCGTG
jgi:hypothetical protein